MATKKKTPEPEAPKAPKKPKTKAKPKAKAKPKTPRKQAATVPKLEDVAKAKGKQEFVKVARTKNKKKPRTWVIVYKLMTGPDVDVSKSRKMTPDSKR